MANEGQAGSGLVFCFFFGFEPCNTGQSLLLAPAGRGDWLACQITSNPYSEPAPVMRREEDFAAGALVVVSYARPAKLFTANEGLFASIPARAKANKLDEVKASVIALLRGEGG